MRIRRPLRPGLLAVALALLTIWVAIPVTVVSGYLPAAVTRHHLAWIVLLVGTVAAIAVAVWLTDGSADRRRDARPLVPAVRGWVDRVELAEVVAALTAPGSEPVALTTGLVGAGGFGKTTLAAKACGNRHVRQSFRDGIEWVTVGRDTTGPELAAKISEAMTASGDGGAAFTDPEQAGRAMARVLSDRGRTLLVADDVWTAAQLEPFIAAAGTTCRLLITTRRPAVLVGIQVRIQVDAMPDRGARLLLRRGLPDIPARQEQDLLELTGRWPLLLDLVNRRLTDDLECGAGIDKAAATAAGQLRQRGPAALDIADSGKRETAVAATIDYSLDALAPAERARFAELGIFSEDADISVTMAAMLWQRTGGLSPAASESLCERLHGLSLLTLAWAGGDSRVLVIHDVIRDFTLRRLGPGGQAAAHAALIDAARQLTGTARESGSPQREGTAWWRLPETAEYEYLRDHLTYHLQAAGLHEELDTTCCDLRYLSVRLVRSGPAAVAADLARSGSPTAARLRDVIARDAQLLAPMEPASGLITTFTSRLGGIPELSDQLPALRSSLHTWTAWPRWVPPELPDKPIRVIGPDEEVSPPIAISPDGSWLATASKDGMVRTLHTNGTPRSTFTSSSSTDDDRVRALAICANGALLATVGSSGTVRVWNADGTPHAVFRTGDRRLLAMAIASDGTWLATANMDGTVRTWHTDGSPRAICTGHGDRVDSVAISPDGTWLATASFDKTVRTWSADGAPRTAARIGHDGLASRVAISPDGTWFAASGDGTVRTWSADGTPRAKFFARHNEHIFRYGTTVRAIAISPDGIWLATCGDSTVRTWNADGTPRAIYRHREQVTAVAISPDGTWLATAGYDKTIRIWSTWEVPYTICTGHPDRVSAVAVSPDGTWLVTVSYGVQIWNADGTHRVTLTGTESVVKAVAISPDSTWFATGSLNGKVQTWNPDGIARATLSGHRSGVEAMAISPDGTWLATGSGGSDGTFRTWNADGTPRAVIAGRQGSVNDVAISPDGTWLATAGTFSAQIWNADGTVRTTLVGHGSWMRDVAISPDGTWLATSSGDGTARTWNADGTPRTIVSGHHSTGAHLAISPDGAWLAIVDYPRATVRIWPADRTDSPPVTAIRIRSSMFSCAWFPGSNDLCVAGEYGVHGFSLRPPSDT